MKQFTESQFFCLMAGPSHNLDRNELQVAYEEFAESLDTENMAESDLLFFYMQLCYTRIELNELNCGLTGSKKKCSNPFSYLLKKIASVH